MSELLNDINPDNQPAGFVAVPDSAPLIGVWKRRFLLVSQFLLGQVSVQAVSLLVGFFLLRWMDVLTYAQYSMAWAFQSTVGSLVDVGFTASIVSLVGPRSNDPEVLGRYIRAARYYRIRSFVVVMTLGTLIYPFFVWRQSWGWKIKALLYVGMFGGLLAQNLMMYASALLIHRKLRQYYRAQLTSGIFRQIAYAVMYVTGTLTSWGASWISAIAIGIYGLMYRRQALPLIREPKKPDLEANHEMMRYIAPLVPSIIFTAFQSQLTVVLITCFGKTQSIAEVSALGRLNQLFLVLMAFNSVVIEPYIARIERERLLRRYLQVVAGQVLLGILISGFSFAYPGVLLWFIGPHYAQLRPQIGWVAATASIEYLAVGLWVMNTARRWVYWWGTISYIGAIIITQICAAHYFNINTTSGIIYFDFATNAAVLLVQIVNSLYGFRYGARIPIPSSRLT